FPAGIKPVELLLRYPIEVFWLRSRRIESAQLEVQRVAQQLVQNGLDVIRDVRLASADLALARERVELGGKSARLADNIAELTGLVMRDGDATELDVSNARVDALQAEEQLGRWRSEAEIARERLRTLAGLGLEHWPERVEPGPLPLSEPPAPDSLVKEALASRPDLRAAEIRLESSGERIGLAKAEVFTFTAILSTKPINIHGPALSGPGLDITLPIFNQNQGGIAQARARLEKDARYYNTLRDRVVLEVREALAKMNQARKSHQQWQDQILPPLAAAVRYAEKAYTAGNVSYLFVLETQRKWLDIRLKAASAAADLRRARAELERGIGRNLDYSNPRSKVSSS
ncbi:MAG: TolC family protein, partial [Methylocella sp.]